MSTAIIAGLSLLNAFLAVYWLCQIAELVLALPIAWGVLRGPAVKARAFLGVIGRLIGTLVVATMWSLTMLEITGYSWLANNSYPNWFFHSGSCGLGLVIILTIASSRFREELEGSAWRRVSGFIRPSKTQRS